MQSVSTLAWPTVTQSEAAGANSRLPTTVPSPHTSLRPSFTSTDARVMKPLTGVAMAFVNVLLQGIRALLSLSRERSDVT
jgi:hypothetical protein